jgi:cysteine synthase
VPASHAKDKLAPTCHSHAGYGKCEFLNPSGSIKDWLAKTVLLDAHKRGLLRPDSIILECSSGNTCIPLRLL